MKKYFRQAVLLYGILAEAKREKVPAFLRNAVPWNLLPWWSKQPKKDIEDSIDSGPDCYPERGEGSLEILRRSAPQNDN